MLPVDDSSPGNMALSPLSLCHLRRLGIKKRWTDFLATQAGTREARGGPEFLLDFRQFIGPIVVSQQSQRKLPNHAPAKLLQIDSLRMSSPVPFLLLDSKLLKDPDWEYIPGPLGFWSRRTCQKPWSAWPEVGGNLSERGEKLGNPPLVAWCGLNFHYFLLPIKIDLSWRPCHDLGRLDSQVGPSTSGCLEWLGRGHSGPTMWVKHFGLDHFKMCSWPQMAQCYCWGFLRATGLLEHARHLPGLGCGCWVWW